MWKPRKKHEVKARQEQVSNETREMKTPPEPILKHDSAKFKESTPNITHQAKFLFITRDRQRAIKLTRASDIKRFGGRTRVKAQRALAVLDIGSRKFDIKWLPDKKANAATDAIKQIYDIDKSLERPRFRLITDKGKEFQKGFTKYVQENLKVRHVRKDGDYSHLGVVDRRIQMFKEQGEDLQDDYERPGKNKDDFDWEKYRKIFYQR